MKKLAYALILSGLVGAPTVAMAAEESPHKLAANVTLTSDYLFRGISQTGGDAAIQGGFDYTHTSGFYLGTWASNVGWIEDFQGYGSGNMEIDLYGGFRGSFADDFTFDVGAIQYWYPGKRFNTFTATTAVDADTTELYGALGWKWFTVKYSYYLSDEVFGFANADGSDYLAISGSFPIGESGFTVGASWGTFNFDNNPNQDYDDWSVSGTYDMGKLSKVTEGVTVGVKYTDTNADRAFWTDANGEFLGDDTVAVWVTKAF
jgi:uncharacterized protein (TIGR02001 family)